MCDSPPTRWPAVLVALLLVACDRGDVQVLVKAEDTIPNGLEPGTGPENVVDGWRVTYERFLLVFGDFRASRSAAPNELLASNDVQVIDMRHLPSAGQVIASFEDVLPTRWDRVGFDLRTSSPEAIQTDGLADADYALMVDNGYSLYLEGKIEKVGGQQCLPAHPSDCVARDSVSFAWGLRVPTAFDGCASPGGNSGFTVPSGGSAQVEPTIHGDHWFFTNITQGEELTQRRAQWIADADTNRDGMTTLAELTGTPASQLFTSSLGYNLTGSILPAIETARDYLEAQARTIGDYNGDGECEERVILAN